MDNKPIGMIIKQIVHKKNLSTTRLAGKLGLSRQAIYNSYSRTSMNEDELEKWSEALGVDLKGFSEVGDNVQESESAGQAALENIRKMFEAELREKNEQIRALQEALRQAQQIQTVLLGKSPEYSDRSIIPLHRNTALAFARV